jgi:cyanophycin synthetase
MSTSNSITRQLFIAEIERRGYSYDFLLDNSKEKMLRVRANGKTSIFFGTRPSESSANGMIITKRKSLSYSFIEASGFKPIPYLLLENNDGDAEAFLATHKKIVVKPNDAGQSDGVTAGITNPEDLKHALKFAGTFSSSVVLQKQVEGNLYRLLFLGGKLFAAARLYGAEITGDGVNTIETLIEQKNAHPLRGNTEEAPLKPINTELAAEHIHPRKLNDILGKNEVLQLSDIPSLSRGGETEDVTTHVHEKYIEIFTHMLDQMGQVICAVEVITDDISSYETGILPVIEFNSIPGTRPHLHPTRGGISRNPIPAILDYVFETP